MSEIIIPNEQQKQAIDHDQGPLLIVAGAGTGKTRVLTDRIANLILLEKAKVHEVLAMTFTEKAAQEMEKRVSKNLPYGYVDLWVMTFHSFCDKLLKAHALDIGLPNNYKLLDQTQTWLLVRKNLEKFNLDYYQPLGNPTKFIHALINHFSRCKDEGITPEQYLEYAEQLKLNTDSREFIQKIDLSDLTKQEQEELKKSEILRLQEVANAFHVYQQLLIENESLDFADLLLYVVELFKQRPLILQKYRSQFKYILVDEFQDTNTIQYELIKMLAAPKNNLTVVGDDDQSIYRFRGASISNIMQFKQDYPNCREVVLIKNYRCGQEILDKSYEFIKLNNPYRLEEKLKINKQLQSQIRQPALIEHLHFDNYKNEAIGVVNKILAIKQDDKSSDWSDFAILFRANDSAKIFINLLEQAKIPFQYFALKGLYQKSIILDVINYFKLLDDYHESSAIYRVLNFPIWDLAATQIVKLTHYAKKKSLSLYEAMKQCNVIAGLTADTCKKLNNIISLVERHTNFVQNNITSEVYNKILRDTGYLEYLVKKDDQKAHENLQHLGKFFEKIQEYEESQEDGHLSGFLQLIKMEIESGEKGTLALDSQAGPQMVNVMTVHMAKGLEFKYVFIVNLVDRKFPCDDRQEPIEIPDSLVKAVLPAGDSHLQEERRLFYVAMTRAKQGLYFTSADDYGGVRRKKLSCFLTDLGYQQPQVKISKQASIEKQQTKIVKKIILPKAYSYSSLSMYERCPYQFYFAKILNIPSFGSDQLTFGNVIHNTLKIFVEQCFDIRNTVQTDIFGTPQGKNSLNNILSFDELIKIYEQNWSDDWYSNKQSKQKYHTKGKKVLKNFYQDFVSQKPRVKHIEQPFCYKLENNIIRGRIDRIDGAKQSVQIIDYKTGRSKSDKLSAADKQQLVLYSIVAEEIFSFKVEKLVYYYLEQDKKINICATDQDKKKLKEKFIKIINKIKQNDFEPSPNQHVCQFCDYKDICDYKKI